MVREPGNSPEQAPRRARSSQPPDQAALTSPGPRPDPGPATQRRFAQPIVDDGLALARNVPEPAPALPADRTADYSANLDTDAVPGLGYSSTEIDQRVMRFQSEWEARARTPFGRLLASRGEAQ